MTIFLMALKIIGWILLILFLLVLILLLLVLFVPVRYRASVKMHDQMRAAVRASWLFPVVRFVMDYTDGGIDGRLCVFGIPVMKFPDAEKPAEHENEDKDKNPASSDHLQSTEKPDFQEDENNQTISEENISVEHSQPEPNEALNNESAPEEVPKNGTQSSGRETDAPPPKPKKKKHVSIFKRIRDFFASVLGMLKNIREFIVKIKELLTDEKNRTAFSHLKREVAYLLKKSVPGRMKVQAVYSTGSPDTTGEVLGIIAMFPAAYKNRWNIVPDFEADHFYVDGEADISGRIFIYQLVGIILRILRDKNCRRLFIKLKG